MCSNKICSRICTGKHVSSVFAIRMVWNKKKLYCHSFPTLVYNMPLGRSKKIWSYWNWM